MNLLKIMAMLALAGLAQALAAAPPAIEEAYEVSAKDVTLPANEFGSVILRQCDGCDRVTLRVSGETRYVFRGQAATLRAFREMVLDMEGRDDAVVTVIYRPADGRVRVINVSPAPAERGGPQLTTRG